MKVLVVENLTYYYPGSIKPTLKNVSLEIEKGDFIIITGPSGSGKSTLIRTFNGLIPHFYKGRFEGRVLVFGIDTRKASVAELSKKVGVVFQDPENQILTLSVEREIAFGLENLGVDPEEIRLRIDEALRNLRIEHLRYRVPFELSIGEQQKVVTAAILAMKPEILVFDEPTAHMDPLSALMFTQILNELNKQGYTIIVVEHRLDLLVKYANRIVVLKDGKIVKIGDPLKVLAEEGVEHIGINVPKYITLFKKLSSYVNVTSIPKSIDEASKILKEIVYGNCDRG